MGRMKEVTYIRTHEPRRVTPNAIESYTKRTVKTCSAILAEQGDTSLVYSLLQTAARKVSRWEARLS